MSPDHWVGVKYGFGVAVGLVVMVVAFESMHWYGYMKANPQVGEITGGGIWFNYLMFMLGVVIAFTAFISGLQCAINLDTEDESSRAE